MSFNFTNISYSINKNIVLNVCEQKSSLNVQFSHCVEELKNDCSIEINELAAENTIFILKSVCFIYLYPIYESVIYREDPRRRRIYWQRRVE